MANWTARRSAKARANRAGDVQHPEEAQNPRIELPNIVLYVDYSDLDDPARVFTPEGVSVNQVRIASDSMASILEFAAKECARFNQMDASRITSLQTELTNFPPGEIALPALPDIAKQKAMVTARDDLWRTVFDTLSQPGINLTKEQVAAAAAIDPTVNDKLAVFEAALADATVKG